MDQRTNQILFALLRSAICGTRLTEEALRAYSPELLQSLLKISVRHDIIHLLVLGLKQNALISKENADIEKHILKAIYRYERSRAECGDLCHALEKAQIPFILLKGSVLRDYYPEAWMRTSGDIDILVHREDLDTAIAYLTENLKYVEKIRSIYDVFLISPKGMHLELHFVLKDGAEVMNSVWENTTLHKNSAYWRDMRDPYFYFYHIAHMARHFVDGGCGIRPFIDLWILDHMEDADRSARDALLDQGGLLQFANACRALCGVWFDDGEPDALTFQMQDFILRGGVYGSSDNRVVLHQKKKGGRIGYMLSRIFVPYEKLRWYYPILEKHPWLMPVMQIRRWFMLFQPNVAKMAKREIAANSNIEKSKAAEMKDFLNDLGLT